MPLKVWWTFQEDNQNFSYNLTTNDGIVITRTSKKISSFMIEALKARHRGNYTCFVQNKAGTTSHSAYLAINGLNLIFIQSSSQVSRIFRILQFEF